MNIRFNSYCGKYDREHYEKLFWSRVVQGSVDECWQWLGSKRDNGYGKFSICEIEYSSHRLAYYFTYGDIPKGMVIMHSCNNGWCCNPSHLSVGTYKENSEYASKCKRTNWGGKCPFAKLNNEQARAIKYSDESNTVLARLYNVSNQTIWRIKKGLTFKHV
jgi:hypothetical protein